MDPYQETRLNRWSSSDQEYRDWSWWRWDPAQQYQRHLSVRPDRGCRPPRDGKSSGSKLKSRERSRSRSACRKVLLRPRQDKEEDAPEIPDKHFAGLFEWCISFDGEYAFVVHHEPGHEVFFQTSKNLAGSVLEIDGKVEQLFVEAKQGHWQPHLLGHKAQHAEVKTGQFRSLHVVGCAYSKKSRAHATALALAVAALALSEDKEREVLQGEWAPPFRELVREARRSHPDLQTAQKMLLSNLACRTSASLPRTPALPSTDSRMRAIPPGPITVEDVERVSSKCSDLEDEKDRVNWALDKTKAQVNLAEDREGAQVRENRQVEQLIKNLQDELSNEAKVHTSAMLEKERAVRSYADCCGELQRSKTEILHMRSELNHAVAELHRLEEQSLQVKTLQLDLRNEVQKLLGENHEEEEAAALLRGTVRQLQDELMKARAARDNKARAGDHHRQPCTVTQDIGILSSFLQRLAGFFLPARLVAAAQASSSCRSAVGGRGGQIPFGS